MGEVKFRRESPVCKDEDNRNLYSFISFDLTVSPNLLLPDYTQNIESSVKLEFPD